MKQKDLKNLALMGITSGIIIASQSNAQAEEAFPNTVSGHYLADGCGRNKCSHTANNDRGYSNQGYFYNQDQNQTYYYQQGPSEASRLQQNTRQNSRNSNQSQQYNNSQYQNNQQDDNQFYQGSYDKA